MPIIVLKVDPVVVKAFKGPWTLLKALDNWFFDEITPFKADNVLSTCLAPSFFCLAVNGGKLHITSGVNKDSGFYEKEVDIKGLDLESEMIEAIKFAHDEIKNHCLVQLELTNELGKENKREYSHENHDQEFEENVMAYCYDKFYSVAKKASDKHARSNDFKTIKEAFKETLSEEELVEKSFMLGAYFKKAEKKLLETWF